MNERFKQVINSEKPVVVDFYADWCLPCKQVTPVLKELKEDLKESVRIIKVNVDKNPGIASYYNIRSIPTLFIFKNGQLLWSTSGVRTASELKSVINRHI